MLTRKEFETLYYHVIQDMSFKEEGTFNTGRDFEKFDAKSAEIVKKALYKIEQEFSK